MIWLGIDPGATGGYAMWSADDMRLIYVRAFKHRSPVEVVNDVIAAVCGLHGPFAGAVVEKNNTGTPNMGRTSVATFSHQTGWNLGMLDTLSVTHALRWMEVRAAAWQRALHIPATNFELGDKKRKKLLQQFLRRRHPEVDCNQEMTDAVLIASAAALLWTNDQRGRSVSTG